LNELFFFVEREIHGHPAPRERSAFTIMIPSLKKFHKIFSFFCVPWLPGTGHRHQYQDIACCLTKNKIEVTDFNRPTINSGWLVLFIQIPKARSNIQPPQLE